MATETAAKSPAKSEKRKNAWKNLPDVWALMKPRRGLLALGFVLMAINRLSGLVLPASTKYLVDNVISKRQIQLLTPIVLAVSCGDRPSGTDVVHADPSALQVRAKK